MSDSSCLPSQRSPAKTRVSYRRSCRPAFASRVRLCHKQEENKARENNCGSKLSLLGQCLKEDLKAGRTGSARLGLTLAFSYPSPWADTMVTGTSDGRGSQEVARPSHTHHRHWTPSSKLPRSPFHSPLRFSVQP